LNRKIAQLFQPRLQLYFVCLIVFALLSALYSVPLAVTELVIVLGLGLYNRENSRRRRREIGKYLDSVTGTVDTATKDTMVNSPLPMVIFRPESGDIISDGIAFGAIQVPSAGQPIIMLADRQTTGGYTKIANVITADFRYLAQLKAGDKVRFVKVSVEFAQYTLLAQRAALRALEAINS